VKDHIYFKIVRTSAVHYFVIISSYITMKRLHACIARTVFIK